LWLPRGTNANQCFMPMTNQDRAKDLDEKDRAKDLARQHGLAGASRDDRLTPIGPPFSSSC